MDVAVDNKPRNADGLSRSEAVQRARSHWQFIKSVVVTSQRKFKTGESSSLTTAEATFLNMITKSRLEVDRDIVNARGSYCGRNQSSPSAARFRHGRKSLAAQVDDCSNGRSGSPEKVDQLGVSGRTHFSHLVHAAMAKERLRDAITARLADLSTAETKFLTKLVANRNVTLQALQNAVNVLNNDPLYNPNLRREEKTKEEEEDDDDHSGRFHQEADVESDVVERVEILKDQLSKVSSPREASGIKSSMLFDGMLDASVRSVAAPGHGGFGEVDIDKSVRNKARWNNVIDASMHRRRAIRRRASVAESSVWNLARGVPNRADADEVRDDRSPPRLIGLAPGGEMDSLGESVRSARHGLDSSIHRAPRRFGGGGTRRSSAVGDVLSESTRGRKMAGIDSSFRANRARHEGFERSGSAGSGIGNSRSDSSGNVLDDSVRGRRLAQELAGIESSWGHRRMGSGNGLDGVLGGTLLLDASARSHRASVEEKSMWKLVHGESIELVDDDAILEDEETGLPVKAVGPGETMDPLLMACPVERTPETNNHNPLEVPTMHSGDFLSQSVRLRGRNGMTKQGDSLSQSVRTSRRKIGNMLDPRLHRRRVNKGDDPLQLLQPPLSPVMDDDEEEEEERMDQLLSSSQRSKRGDTRIPSFQEAQRMPAVLETHLSGDELEGGGREQDPIELEQERLENLSMTVSETSQTVSISNMSTLVCCGVDVMANCITVETDVVPDKPNRNKISPDTVCDNGDRREYDSLASKKRYLQLNRNEAMCERQVNLSTWMGAPEDYPILGLSKKRATAGNDEDGDWEMDQGSFEDPLEPHVLSPLLMKCLRDHLPYALQEENFWLRYSLVRDGASLDTVFDTMRHSQHTVLAIETSHGEVLGSFTSSPWRSNGNHYYGSCEAFVWMLRKSRRNNEGEDSCQSLDEYILRESSLEVFPWNAKEGNRNVQLSNRRKLFVGGGDPEAEDDGMWRDNSGGEESKMKDPDSQWGMALALDKELIHGTSSRCATFGSSPLIDKSRHEGSEVFEIMNMEIWALTPCMNEEMAEELDLGRTFVMGFHHQESKSSFHQ